MINIFKSINYSAKRDVVTWVTLLSLIIFPILIVITKLDEVTLSYYFSNNMSDCYYISIIGILILSCRIAMGDAGDNTLNYEIMAGHRRIKVFLGRLTAGVLWGAVIVTLANIFPVIFFYLLNGSGDAVNLGEILSRAALSFFPSLRLCTLFVLFASVLRSAGKGICIGYVALLICAMLMGLLDYIFEIKTDYILAVGNSEMILAGGSGALSSETVIKTITVSLAVSVVYCLIDYLDFRRKEL